MPNKPTITARVRQYAARILNSGVARPAQWFIDWAQGGRTASSGERVNERTALGIAAYLACIKNISEDVAKLPLPILKPQGRGSETLYDHNLFTVFNHVANDEMTGFSLRETINSHALGWHGGFAEIVRDGAGNTRQLWPLDPTCVVRKRDQYGADRRLYYEVHGMRFQARDIFDIHGLGYDGVSGYVLAQLAKDPLGNMLAAQKFVGSYYKHGTSSPGVISVADAMSETAFKHLRESFAERHGGAENQQKPIILEQGATWTNVASSAKDNMMIEALASGIEEAARLFRMPLHKIGHLARSTNNNIEQQALEYVIDTLLSWLIRWEQEIWRKLLTPREQKAGLYARHNVNMLLRGDMAARAEFYRVMSGIGVFSINDIREKEDMNPIDGGDVPFVNATMVPLPLAAEGKHLTTMQPKTEPAAPKQAVPAPKEPATAKNAIDTSHREHQQELLARIAAAHTKSIQEALAGLLRVEHDKAARAEKKDGLGKWGAEFYGASHQEVAAQRLSPAISALEASLSAITNGAAHV